MPLLNQSILLRTFKNAFFNATQRTCVTAVCPCTEVSRRETDSRANDRLQNVSGIILYSSFNCSD